MDHTLSDRPLAAAPILAAFCWLVVGAVGGWFANGIFGRDLPVLGMSAPLSAMTRDAVFRAPDLCS